MRSLEPEPDLPEEDWVPDTEDPTESTDIAESRRSPLWLLADSDFLARMIFLKASSDRMIKSERTYPHNSGLILRRMGSSSEAGMLVGSLLTAWM